MSSITYQETYQEKARSLLRKVGKERFLIIDG